MDPNHPGGDPEPAALVADGSTGHPLWTLSDPLVAYLASVILAVVVGSVWISVTGDEDVTLGLTVTTLFAQWAGMLGGTVLASRRRGTGRVAADLGLRFERQDVPVGIAVGVVAQLVLLPLLYIPVSFLVDDLDISEEARELTGLGSGAGLVLLSVMIVVGAPLVEEIFFRGLLQQSLNRRFGARSALAGSAVLFGLTHFQPLLLPGLIAFGVVLGLLARRSGRLGPAVIAHMAFNAVTVIALTASRA